MKWIKYISLFVALASLLSCASDTERIAVIQTTFGDIRVKLYDSTPRHRDNFVKLVEKGFYDDLLFHRVIPNFMIQGGDPDSREASPNRPLGQGGPGYELDAEINAIHKRGALAAARLGDDVNPERKSSGSQFYIVQGQTYTDEALDQIAQKLGITFTPEARELYKTVGGAPALDEQYSVFGEVIEGMQVVDQIAAQPRGRYERPREDIRMQIKMEN